MKRQRLECYYFSSMYQPLWIIRHIKHKTNIYLLRIFSFNCVLSLSRRRFDCNFFYSSMASLSFFIGIIGQFSSFSSNFLSVSRIIYLILIFICFNPSFFFNYILLFLFVCGRECNFHTGFCLSHVSKTIEIFFFSAIYRKVIIYSTVYYIYELN